MHRAGVLLTVSAGLALLPSAVLAQKQPPPAEGPRIIRLAVNPGGSPPVPALIYRLLPDPLDREPGNAAPLWLRASRAADAERRKWKPGEFSWYVKGGHEPTNEEIQELLKRFGTALRVADEAARREHCDWGRPPLTFQNLSDNLPLFEVQAVRQVASLLHLRAQLAIREKRFEDALHSLQVGFALARDVTRGHTLIESLVGIAIAQIMLGNVEELMQTPGSPNLYWALTTLPRPLIDVRPAMRYELNTLYRSFPPLRALQKSRLSPQEVGALIDRLFQAMKQVSGQGLPGWVGRLGFSVLAARDYAEAKRYLLARGRSAKEVDALPMLQAVALYYLGQYDELRDDVLKWLSVPPYQGREGLDRVVRNVRPGQSGNNPLVVILGLLIQTMDKTYAAQVRLERHVAGLRAAEALRGYAATHAGKPPERWQEITDVPRPIDPVTGKGFDALYTRKDGRAELTVPPPPGQPAVIGRRFELAPSR